MFFLFWKILAFFQPEKYDVHTKVQRILVGKLALICQFLIYKKKIARFLQQVPRSSQNIKGFFFKKKNSYLVYNQIWLNILCGCSRVWLHQKVENKQLLEPS